MKTFILMVSLIFCYGLLGCTHTTEVREVRYEPAPQQTYEQPKQPPRQEPVREEIIEERTTTYVVDEYEKVEGPNNRRPAKKTYSEDEYEDGSTRERVIYEDTVVE